MLTSLVDVPSGTDFSELGEDKKFTWTQFHVKGWGARDFERHAMVDIHNAPWWAVPLTWLLFYSQSTVYLITNPKIPTLYAYTATLGSRLWTGSLSDLATELSGTNRQGSPTLFQC